MEQHDFNLRLAKLRLANGVSARDMSLTMGQNENYINQIENGKTLPSMQMFFSICDYFGITPKEFFDDGVGYPAQLNALITDLATLDWAQLQTIHQLVRQLNG